MDQSNIDELAKAFKKPKANKTNLIFLIIGIVAFLGGIVCILFVLLAPKDIITDLVFPEIPSKNDTATKIYSDLTGQELSSEAEKTAPAYCVQTPNDTYGARPQTGLTTAGVVFEAIAEGGITRFAAIYQNPSSGIIGAVRSLRLYYLDWDMPFDCTVIHAGGSIEAINAVSSRGTKDLVENYNYMYRGNYNYHSYDNIFLTPKSLSNFSSDYGYTTSNIKGFARQTPQIANKARIDSQANNPLVITKATDSDTSKLTAQVTNVRLGFGGYDSYNVSYSYNSETNSYDRSYDYGGAHEVYLCNTDQDYFGQDPTDVCPLVQVSPKVVIGMFVDESLHRDGVHEAITTVGSDTAYIFQNGTAIKGTWKKDSLESQIKFYDESGNEIALIPGQTWISAIPKAYGGYVEY